MIVNKKELADNYKTVAIVLNHYFIGYKPKEKIKQIERGLLKNQDETNQLLGEKYVMRLIKYQDAGIDFMEKGYRPKELGCPFEWLKSFYEDARTHLSEILQHASPRETKGLEICINGKHNKITSLEFIKQEVHDVMGGISKKELEEEDNEEVEKFKVNKLDG